MTDQRIGQLISYTLSLSQDKNTSSYYFIHSEYQSDLE